MIVFICLNFCFCKRVRWICVVDLWNFVFVCGQVLDGVLSYDDDNHFVRRTVYWFVDGEFYLCLRGEWYCSGQEVGGGCDIFFGC